MSAVWFETIGGDTRPEACFELYHENSKVIRHSRAHAPAFVDVPVLVEASFDASPAFILPSGSLPPVALGAPASTAMRPGRLSQATLAALMAPLNFGRAGERDPLEVYFHASAVTELAGGLFHYDRGRNVVQLMRRGDLTTAIAGTLIDPQSARTSAIQIFVAGSFQRAARTAAERGYRTTLMAAGALARDISLVATSLGLANIATDGFYDREIDTILGLDGLTAGTLYMIAAGEAGGLG